MPRPPATLLAVSALALAGCGDKEIRDNTNDRPTAAVKRLLAAGEAPQCDRESPRAAALAFVEAHPELTNKQLARICPDLYPRDYLKDNKD